MMHPEVLKGSPLRSPQWRYDRVVEMLRHRPQALRVQWHDDRFIRRARRVLLELEAARDDAARQVIYHDEADIWCAMAIYNSPDPLTRQMLEACLLIPEFSFEELGTRFATEPRTIEYYHALFFEVRPYLESSDWIGKVIRAEFDPLLGKTNSDAGAFGYCLKWFAYFGGRYVLEAAVTRLHAVETPKSREEVLRWLDDALSAEVRTSGLTAALTMPINSKNGLKLIKMAFKNRRPVRVANKEDAKRNELLEKTLALMEASLNQGTTWRSARPEQEDRGQTTPEASPEWANDSQREASNVPANSYAAATSAHDVPHTADVAATTGS